MLKKEQEKQIRDRYTNRCIIERSRDAEVYAILPVQYFPELKEELANYVPLHAWHAYYIKRLCPNNRVLYLLTHAHQEIFYSLCEAYAVMLCRLAGRRRGKRTGAVSAYVRKCVLEQYQKACVLTGSPKIQVSWILPPDQYPELAGEVTNYILLCKDRAAVIEAMSIAERIEYVYTHAQDAVYHTVLWSLAILSTQFVDYVSRKRNI